MKRSEMMLDWWTLKDFAHGLSIAIAIGLGLAVVACAAPTVIRAAAWAFFS